MPTADAGGAGDPLVILAAGGALPVEVAEAAVAGGRRLLVIALEGAADPRLETFPHAYVKFGQIGRIESLIAGHGGSDLVLVGTVSQRPDYSSIGLDFGALRYLPRLIKAMVGGDDTVLGNFIKAFEERGLRVVGPHEVAPELVARPGHVAGPPPSPAMLAEAGLAFAAVRAIGDLDIGQGAVAVGGRVVALEAAEGTDAMIARVGELRAAGRVKWQGRAGVFAKRAKPKQDLRVDMPVIGPQTVERVAAAGLAGIVIEAGKVMIAERGKAAATADRTGTFIFADGGGAA